MNITCFQILPSHKMMTSVDIIFNLVGFAGTVGLVLLPVRCLVQLGTVADSTAS